jgi:hypothetical protein
MDCKEKEPKALVEITVTWHEPEATAKGKWRRQSCKRRSPRVLYTFHFLFISLLAQRNEPKKRHPRSRPSISIGTNIGLIIQAAPGAVNASHLLKQSSSSALEK